MTTASYITDLVDIITDMPATTGWTALGGGASGLIAPETDVFVQGASCISKGAWSTATKGMVYTLAAAQTIPAGSAIWMWCIFWAPNDLGTESAGGMQLLAGPSATAYYSWYVRGSDTILYGAPWVMAIVDPTVTPNATTGTPTSSWTTFGGVAYLPAGGPSKGNPWAVDAIRYGSTMTITNGDATNGYASFVGADNTDATIANVWGFLQKTDGGYYMRGRLLIGNSTVSSSFVDSNINILASRLTKTSSTFNKIEIQNTATTVSWTGINFSQLLGSPQTVTRLSFLVTNNAVITINNCTFSDCGTSSWLSSTSISSSTFTRCDDITLVSGMTFSTNTIQNSYSNIAITTNSLSAISSCSFISNGVGHGITITSTGTYTFSGNHFTGYASTNGTTGNEAIFNNSGGAVTINVTNGGGTPTIRNGTGASTIINNAVSVSVNVIDQNNSPIVGDGTSTGARVAIYLSSNLTTTGNILGPAYTNSSGTVSGSYNYTVNSAIVVRVRLDSPGGPRYVPVDTSGTITSAGFTTTVKMLPDTIAV